MVVTDKQPDPERQGKAIAPKEGSLFHAANMPLSHPHPRVQLRTLQRLL